MTTAKTNKKVSTKKSVKKTNRIPTNRDGTVKVEYLKEIHNARSPRSRAMDDKREARRIYPSNLTPEQAKPWIMNPGRYDIAGIDTRSKANYYPGIPTNPDGTVKVEYLVARHNARTVRAQAQDNRKNAARILPISLTPEQASYWLRKPGYYDISGIDSEKEPNVKFRKKSTTAKTTKSKGAGTKPRTTGVKKPVEKKPATSKTSTAKKPVEKKPDNDDYLPVYHVDGDGNVTRNSRFEDMIRRYM